MNKEELRELSKKKYIWVYYMASDCTIHKEKYPVIYSNVTVVYYKKGTGMYLELVAQPRIARSEEVLRSGINHLLVRASIESVLHSWVDIDISEYQTNARKNKKQAELNAWLNVLNRRKKDYEDSSAAVEKLKKELEEMG